MDESEDESRDITMIAQKHTKTSGRQVRTILPLPVEISTVFKRMIALQASRKGLLAIQVTRVA